MTANINSETGEYLSNEGRSPRFSLWAFLMMCSVITLKSSAEIKSDMEKHTDHRAVRWAVACSAVTLTVTILVLIAHLIPIASTLIVGTKVEGALTFVLVIFWVATVGVVNETSHTNLGTVSQGEVLNANLYYFSWGGFALSIFLFVSYLKSAYGLDLTSSAQRAQRLFHWGGLLAATLVVLGSGTRTFVEDCDKGDAKHAYCSRTKVAVAYGVIGVIISLAIVGVKLFKTITPITAEFGISTIFAVAGGFAVSFITSNKGPGAEIGNLYYSSWISLIVSIVIAVECFNVYKRGNGDVHEGSDVNNDVSDDLQKPELNMEEVEDTERGYD